MIVICTGCQARFRVADEKVGPRGARVRCSRCQTVFVVKAEAAAEAPPIAPRIELELTPGLGGPSPARRSVPAPAGASVIPFRATPAQPRPRPPDPFAAAGLDAFGEPAPAAEDPFARVGAAPAAPDLRPAGLGEPMAMGGAAAPPTEDPFAQAAAPMPASFGGMSTGTTGAQALPVTDLSQLLGSAAAGVPASPVAPPAPPAASAAMEAYAAQLGVGPELGTELGTEPQMGAEPAFGAEPFPPAEPQLGAEPPPGAPGFAADLALEEHSASHQAPFADPADVVMSAEAPPAAFGGAAFESGPLGSLPGSESLSLATEPTPGPPEAERPPASPESAPAAEPGPRQIAAAAAREENQPHESGPAHPGPSAASRLRAAAVNALALVALLAVALGFWVVLRGDASLGPAALRPSTLLRILGRVPPQSGPFEVAGVHAGVYAQSSGGMVLFVRGEVVSRAPASVAGVRVEAELVRGGEVLARGEGRAGVVPSPEELDRATDRAALDTLAAAARKRAPKAVAPGDRLGFLVTIGDAPADVSGASVRVRAEAAGAVE